jgi:hypothetical protein
MVKKEEWARICKKSSAYENLTEVDTTQVSKWAHGVNDAMRRFLAAGATDLIQVPGAGRSSKKLPYALCQTIAAGAVRFTGE